MKHTCVQFLGAMHAAGNVVRGYFDGCCLQQDTAFITCNVGFECGKECVVCYTVACDSKVHVYSLFAIQDCAQSHDVSCASFFVCLCAGRICCRNSVSAS